MYHRSVTVYDRFLGNLSTLLAKAEAHCTARNIKPDALLGFRLYPDMFPLIRQVQLACDFAARASARLAGEEPKTFVDTETGFAELQARIRSVRTYIAGFDPAVIEGAGARMVKLRIRGEEVALNGETFLNYYSLPQFYFHITTAYNILRHNGVEVGKGDYMGG